jgi:hypothetical protein
MRKKVTLLLINLEYQRNKFGLKKLFAAKKDSEKIRKRFKEYNVVEINDQDAPVTKKQVLTKISNIEDNFILYFSGHCLKDKFFLNDEFINSQEFFDSINTHTLAIFDCCNCNGLQLPYRLMDNFYLEKVDKMEKNITCLTASRSYQKTAMSSNGSVFTDLLLKIWPADYKDWSIFFKDFQKAYRKTIIREYNFQQQIVITSTDHNLKIMDWIK